MQRFAAVVLGLAVGFSGSRSGLHVHAYTDHDHPDHHHGLAVHDHHDGEPHDETTDAGLDECDPARHVLTLAALCAAPPELWPIDTAQAAAAIVFSHPRSHVPVHFTEVRAHGPPLDAHLSPRAPPLEPLRLIT